LVTKAILMMSTAELKNILKERIEGLDENHLLEELLNIIDLESDKSGVIKIPKEHKKSLDTSLSQVDNGKTISHQDVM